MSNRTWACFECRETVRRPSNTRRTVLCPVCGQPCRYLGYKLRMPPKSKAKAWRELLAAIQGATVAFVELEHRLRVQ